MSMQDELRTLISEFEKSETALAKITSFHQDYVSRNRDLADTTTEQAIVIAEVLTNYYTCLETLFLRVSQFFENTLVTDRWHQDLLHKMTLQIEGVREPVLSDRTAGLLSELLKFRHFRRYYFEFDYDWDRLDYLRKKFAELQPLVNADLARFRAFLDSLLKASGVGDE